MQAKISCAELGVLDGPLLLFGGPYSNLQAVEALAAFAAARGIDGGQMICTGDIVAYCGAPRECVAAIRALGCAVVAGNCEVQLASGAEDCGCGFAPGSIFAFVRWASGEHGTIISRIDILRAIGRGEPFQTLPFVRPGGDILLRLGSWAKVQGALAAIDAVEALGLDAADVSPEHWRHVHNRLTAGLEPHAYTPERHASWLGRQRIDP